MSRLIDADELMQAVAESMRNNPHSKGLVRNNHEMEHQHFMRLIHSQPTAYDLQESREVLKELFAGNWVDTDKVQKALGMSFKECFYIFEFSREVSWWSIVGKTEEERARNGQCVITKFRVKRGGAENDTERDT